MKIAELLLETGNKPYAIPPRWRNVGPESAEMRVTLPDGRNLTMYVEHENRMALFSFLVDDEQQTTGGGDAYRIFSTVYQAMNDWVRKHRPLYFAFTGNSEDHGRIRLYDRISQKILTMPSFAGWTNITNRQDLWPEEFEWFIDDKQPTLGMKIYMLMSPAARRQYARY